MRMKCDRNLNLIEVFREYLGEQGGAAVLCIRKSCSECVDLDNIFH